MTSEESEATYREVLATCETENCGNAGIAIPVLVVADEAAPAVQCGVCGQPITNISEVSA